MGRVPRRVGEDHRGQGLSAEESHLLETIDGSFDEEALAFVTGHDLARVADMLDQLALLGLVAFAASPPAPIVASDGIELSPEERQRIDAWAERIKSEDYYRLLGVPRDASTGEVKVAYYRVGPSFHPDKFYGRELGPYKQKVEAVFGALTRAHDALRNRKRREDYDASLGPLKPGDRIPRRDRLDSVPESEPPGAGPRGQRRTAPAAEERSSYRGRSSWPGATSPRPATSSPRPAASSPPWRPSSVSAGPSTPPRRRFESRDPLDGSWDDDGRNSDIGRAPGHRGSDRPRSRFLTDPGAFESRPPPPSIEARRRAAPPRQPPADPEALRAHREALARKLHRGSVRPPPKPRPATEVRTQQRTPPETSEAVDRSAVEKLRERYDSIGGAARKRRLTRYLQHARFAMQQGDYKTASAAFDQALRLSPADPEIVAEAEQAQRLAALEGQA